MRTGLQISVEQMQLQVLEAEEGLAVPKNYTIYVRSYFIHQDRVFNVFVSV